MSALDSWKCEPPLSPLFPVRYKKIWAIAFSPDGRWLIAGGSGWAAQLWHLYGGSRPMTPVPLNGHAESVDMAAVSDGGLWVATLDHHGTIRLFEPKRTGPEAARVLWNGDQNQAKVIAMSRDGRWLAAGATAGKAFLWSLKGLDPSASMIDLPAHKGDVVSVAFDPDGRHVATADFDGMVQLWDLTGHDNHPGPQPLSGHARAVYALAFSGDGRRLASASLDGSYHVWNTQGSRPIEPPVRRQVGPELMSVAFSPDARRLATGQVNGWIQVWDLEAPTKPAVALSGAPGQISKVAFSPGVGRYLAAESDNGRILLWDFSGVDPVAISLSAVNELPAIVPANALPTHLEGFAFHPDGRTLITRNSRGGLLASNLRELDTSSPFDPFAVRGPGHGWYDAILAKGAGSGTFAGAADEGRRLWSPDAADTSASLVVLDAVPARVPDASGTHGAAAAFGPDGRTVALPLPDGTIKIWDAAAPGGPSATTLMAHTGPGLSVLAFRPGTVGKCRWLASGDDLGAVRLWDLAAATAVNLSGHGGRILSLAFSPDGRWLVAGAAGQPPRLWDLSDRPSSQPTGVLDQAGTASYALAFHPKEPAWLAVGMNTGEVLLLNATDRKVEASPKRLTGHNDPVTRLMFTPDGRRLIAASKVGTVSLYVDPLNQANGPSPLDRHVGGLTSLALSNAAGRHWLATGGADSEVRLWRMDSEPMEKHRIPYARSVGAIVDLAFSGDGRWLAILSGDHNVRVVEVDENGPVLESSFLLTGRDQASTSLVLDEAGRLVIAAGPRGTGAFGLSSGSPGSTSSCLGSPRETCPRMSGSSTSPILPTAKPSIARPCTGAWSTRLAVSRRKARRSKRQNACENSPGSSPLSASIPILLSSTPRPRQ